MSDDEKSIHSYYLDDDNENLSFPLKEKLIPVAFRTVKMDKYSGRGEATPSTI